jgi:recombinational DNA repair protein (RecF pathway)
MTIRARYTEECADCRRDFQLITLKRYDGMLLCSECRWLRREAEREAEYSFEKPPCGGEWNA